jgi:hypothetical protein
VPSGVPVKFGKETIYHFKGLIMPDRFFTQLCYTTGAILLQNVATTGTYLISGNDPRICNVITGTGNPLGYSSFLAFYNRYRIRRSRICVDINNTLQPMRLTLTPTTSTTLPSTVDQALTMQYTTNRMIQTTVSSNKLDEEFETARAYGVVDISQQSGYSGDGSNSPVSLWYWRVRAQSYDGITANTCYATISIVYEVEFYQKVMMIPPALDDEVTDLYIKVEKRKSL